jgi:D-3-phosphoglycerate dehydrogenase
LFGFYEGKLADPVSFVNAKERVDSDGIMVNVDDEGQRTEYASQLSLEARGGGKAYEVSITTFGNDAMRIVSVMGYRLDFAPGKHTLIISYDDKPGQLGIKATMLGDEMINITSMVVGQCAGKGQNLVMLGVDEPVDAGLKAAIDVAVGSGQRWYIQL